MKDNRILNLLGYLLACVIIFVAFALFAPIGVVALLFVIAYAAISSQ